MQEDRSAERKKKLEEKMRQKRKKMLRFKRNFQALQAQEEQRNHSLVTRIRSADARVDRVRRDLERSRVERSVSSQQRMRRIVDFRKLRDEEEDREAEECMDYIV